MTDGTGTGICFCCFLLLFFVLPELFNVELLFFDDEDLLFNIVGGAADGEDDEEDECEGER